RRYYTGAVTTPKLVTYTLRRGGGRAQLAIETSTAGYAPSRGRPIAPGAGVVDSWKLESVVRFTGTSTADTVELRQIGGTAAWKLTCRLLRVDAAHADAIRKRAGSGGECGDKGRWAPAATTKVDVTYCYSREPEGGKPEHAQWNGYEADEL